MALVNHSVVLDNLVNLTNVGIPEELNPLTTEAGKKVTGRYYHICNTKVMALFISKMQEKTELPLYPSY